jgi:hypothetical protein
MVNPQTDNLLSDNEESAVLFLTLSEIKLVVNVGMIQTVTSFLLHACSYLSA